MIARPAPRKSRDSTIAMINVVFLMLVFFVIAGSLTPPRDRDLKLVETSNLEARAPQDALVLRQDGTLVYRGAATTPGDYAAMLEGVLEVRIVPDRAVAAARLVDVAAALRASGVEKIVVVTENALK